MKPYRTQTSMQLAFSRLAASASEDANHCDNDALAPTDDQAREVRSILLRLSQQFHTRVRRIGADRVRARIRRAARKDPMT